jgi:hypothetical protein
MRQLNGDGMNPFPAAVHHRIADSVQIDMFVMVAADCEDRRDFAEIADQVAKLVQHRRPVYQIAAQ